MIIIIVIQVIHIVYMTISRPFKFIEHTVIEIINDIFLLAYICVLFALGSQSDWNKTSVDGILCTIAVNILLITMIIIGKLVL